MTNAANPYANASNAVEPHVKDKFVHIDKRLNWPSILANAINAPGAVFDLDVLEARCVPGEADAALEANIRESESAITKLGFTAFLEEQKTDLRQRGLVLQEDEVRARFAHSTLLDKAVHAAKGAERFITEELEANPNLGEHAKYYPPSLAPPEATKQHVKKIVTSRRGFLVTKDHADRHIGVYHSSPYLVAQKPAPNSLTLSQIEALPITKTTRFCFDGTGSGANQREMKDAIIDGTTPIDCDQLFDICQLIANARRVFPNEDIYCAIDDVDAAYTRVIASERTTRWSPIDVMVNGIQCLLFVCTLWFGFIESGFWWEVIKHCLLENTHKRIEAYILGDATATTNKSLSLLRLAGMYVDDRYVFGPWLLVRQEQVDFKADVGDEQRGALGKGGVSADKTQLNQQVVLLGYALDLALDRVEMTEKTFAKILLLIFLEIPLGTVASHSMPLVLGQKLLSLTFRLSCLVPYHQYLAGPFCNMLKGINSSARYSPKVYWTHEGVVALDWIRRFLFWAVKVPALRSVKTCVPLHVGRAKDETKEQRNMRLIANADILLEIDACGSTQLLAGIMQKPSRKFVVQMLFEDFRPQAGETFHINILELAALTLTLLATVAFSLAEEGEGALRGRTIHILTDSVTAEAHASRQKTDNNLSRALLGIIFYLQIEHGFISTFGRIEGKVNYCSDALTRNFAEKWMLPYKEELQDLPRLLPTEALTSLFASVATCSTSSASFIEQLSATIATSVRQLSFGPNSASR